MKRDRKTKSGRNTVTKGNGFVRIIAGKHRGRKLPVLNAEGLRPTTDRTKETVFNWLMHDIQDATCLDLYAGSGGLGFEALSRSAKTTTFVELDKISGKQLQSNLTTLNVHTDVYRLVIGDALAFLRETSQRYDVIFIDPPFSRGLIAPSIELIIENNVLTDNGLIYIEHESSLPFDGHQYGLNMKKQKRTDQVCYSLWSR